MLVSAIYRHYWPDTTPYARLLRAVLEAWVDAENGAEVLTGQPCYNDVQLEEQPHDEVLGGVRIRRFRLPSARKHQSLRRSGGLVWFLTRSFGSVVMGQRPDIILVNCTPPIAMGLMVRILGRLRGIPYIYHCQDIHPEAMQQAGHMSSRWLYDFLRQLDTETCERAACVVVLSDDMKQTMLERGVSADRLEVINNMALNTYDTADNTSNAAATVDDLLQAFPQQAFFVLFAGNLGNFQGLEEVIDAARLLENDDHIHFLMMGAGLARARLEERAGNLVGNSIHFLGQHSVEVAREAMSRSHLGLVSLSPGVARVAYPSKLMTYVASGCPVLALVEEDSSVAADVVRQELGYVCGDHSPRVIASAIQAAAGDQSRWDGHAAREALRSRGNELFGRAVTLGKWNRLFTRLGGDAATRSSHEDIQ